MSNDLNSLGPIIRFHRKQSGLSQIELARLAGVGKTTIFDIENGKLCIQINTLMKIVRVLNIGFECHSPSMALFRKLLP